MCIQTPPHPSALTSNPRSLPLFPTTLSSQNVPFFSGSPRDLLINASVDALESNLREIPKCSLDYKLYSHRKLLRTQRLLAENEVVGRYDVVAGLVAKDVTPTGHTSASEVPCMGDEGGITGKNIVIVLPSTPKVEIPSTLLVKELDILFAGGRSALENRMLNGISANLTANEGAKAQVLKRRLKVGLHNGHTVLSGEFQSYSLFESKDEPNVLLLEDDVSVRGYVPHELMALVMIVEYDVGMPYDQHQHYNTQALLKNLSKVRDGHMVTTVVMGVSVYVPFNGRKVVLKNTDANEDVDVDIELKLHANKLCNLFTHKPVFTDKEGRIERKNAKARGRKNIDSVVDEDESYDIIVSFNMEEDAAVARPMIETVDEPIATAHRDIADGHESDDSRSDRGGKTGTARFEGGTRESQSKSRSVRHSQDPNHEPVRASQRSLDNRKFEARDEVDSLIEGEPGATTLRLDAHHYQSSAAAREDQRDRPNRGFVAEYAESERNSLVTSVDRHNVRADAYQGSLLTRSLGAPVLGGGRAGGMRDSYDAYDGGMSQRSMGRPPIDSVEHTRNLSRGARARLNRHGFEGAIMDDTPQNAAHLYPKGVGLSRHSASAANPLVDISKELEDTLSLHDISLQFAGLQYGEPVGLNPKNGSTAPKAQGRKPRSVYFSFQFFTCEPTRTEVMKLLPADDGKMHVLARDDAYARNEPPLSLRYIVDTSTSSVTEPVEFAQYLANKILHIDVWDSDSLMLLGTCGVPLARIMRQGQQSTRCAIECDIIDSEADAQAAGGISSCAIRNGGNMSGKVVGAVHVIIANQGQPGRHPVTMRQQLVIKQENDARYNRGPDAAKGANWRVGFDEPKIAGGRPKNAVRARPLSETYPELSDTLAAHRDASTTDKASMRSMTSVRGDDSVHTLNYDDVITLFKEFGGKHGTVQYTNRLMILLDVPSWGVTLRKFLNCFCADRELFANEIVRYASAEGDLSANDLAEFVRATFDRQNARGRPEEVALIVKNFTGEKENAAMIKIEEVSSFCEKESEAQAWGLTSRRLIRAIQDCYLVGIDFEQLLADKDLTGDHHVLIKDFKECLYSISRHGKLDADDITRTVRHFSRKSGSGGHASISLKDVMKFVGKTYVGNVEVRMAAVLKEGGRTVEEIRSTLGGKTKQPYEQIEKGLSNLGAYNVLSHDQVRKVLTKADADGSGAVSADQLLSLLKLTAKPTAASKEKEEDAIVNMAEDLLRVLVERVTTKGLSITEAFRGFDLDGDGSISQDELKEGFSKLGIFENIPNWEAAIPAIVKKFDKSGDGCVELKEFFKELFGVKDYAANIVQDLTKIFATAMDSHGMSIQDIFSEWDTTGRGFIDVAELNDALLKMGTLGQVSKEDTINVMKEIGDAEKVTFELFEHFFGARVQQTAASRRRKKLNKIMIKFRAVVKKVQDKTGSTIADIFSHFDGNKDGDISIEEFKATLRVMKHFKGIEDEDLDLLLMAIDADNSGGVSLTEFLTFINIKDEVSVADTTITDIIAPKIRKLFELAIEKGLNLDDLFVQGDLTIIELSAVLDTLSKKYYPEITSEDTLAFVKFLDRNNNGSISQQEVRIFIAAGKRHAAKLEAAAASPNDTAEEAFLKKEIRRVAAHDGGVQPFLALMDRQGTGFISFATFMHFLKREGVFETTKEEQNVENILQPMSKEGNISCLALMRWMEGHHPDPSGALVALEGEDTYVEYEFSRDPEIHALEKKLRRLGRVMAKKGVNVESLFRAYDKLDLGVIRRTELIEVLSKMGMSILEQGRIMEDGVTTHVQDVTSAQRKQVHRLKGATYKNNAPTSARRLVNGQLDGSPDFKDHMESMALVNSYRQSQKKQLLQQVLSHSLAVDIRVYPRFGKTLYFEQPFTNPFNHEERFIIDVNDPELRVVTNFEEWMQLRATVEPCVGELGPDPIETDMFDRDAYGNIQVALLPHETLFVPFTFMTLVPHTAPPPAPKRKGGRSEGKSGGESKMIDNGKSDGLSASNAVENESPRRSVEVKFISGGHGTFVSVVNVLVCPRPFVVDRTLRFFEPENSVMKRRIHLIDYGNRKMLPGDTVTANKFVHCVENDNVLYGGAQGQSNVVIEWGEASSGGALEMILRYRCGPFPAIGSFYIILYNDAYQSQQHEIWKVVIQSRQRLDVHGPVGSSSLLDLVVQGDKFARRARAHASYTTDQLNFTPDAPFQLVPGAYNRVSVRFSPVSVGTKRLQLNLVDVDSKELISSWILTTTATPPAVVRSYDVDVLDGHPINKKIIFRNPWDIARRFHLTSSDESIMRVRVPAVEVAAHGSAYLRLWFNAGADTEDVYLFLNDGLTGQNEESFLFRVHVSR